MAQRVYPAISKIYLPFEITYTSEFNSRKALVWAPHILDANKVLETLKPYPVTLKCVVTLCKDNTYEAMFNDCFIHPVTVPKTAREEQMVPFKIGGIVAKNKELALLQVLDILDSGVLTGNVVDDTSLA